MTTLVRFYEGSRDNLLTREFVTTVLPGAGATVILWQKAWLVTGVEWVADEGNTLDDLAPPLLLARVIVEKVDL
jgi:hypothetical protein